MLLGERIEIRSAAPPDVALELLGSSIDPRRWGLVTTPGHRDFVGSISGAHFKVRSRRRYWTYAPTAVGAVVADGSGSALQARFTGDVGIRMLSLLLLGFFYVASVGVGEALVIGAIFGLNVLASELAKRPLRDLLRYCMLEPVGPRRWVTS